MRRNLTGGGTALAISFVAVEFFGLLRVAAFAHVLAPASMGVLIIIGTWLRLVEMMTDLSVDRYLLREADGASRLVQQSAHGAALLRGFAGTFMMLGSLWPLMAVYEIEGTGPALAATALVPAIRGFAHFDYRLFNRFYRLAPTMVVELGSAAAGLVVALAGAVIAPGPEAFAAALLTQAAVAVALSHLCARRRYRVGFDRRIASRLWRFGWPLTVNALVLYAVFQGERLLVGGMLGLETLGTYAIVSQLALLPVMICGRLSISLALPALARVRDAARAVAVNADVMAVAAVAGIIFWSGFVVMAPAMITVLFGEAYVPSAADLSWIAAAAAIRLQKTGPATVLLAQSRPRDILAGSGIRIMGLAGGAAALAVTENLTLFIAAAALSEALNHAVISMRAGRVSAGRHRRNVLAPGLVLLPAAVHATWTIAPELLLIGGLAAVTMSAALLLRILMREAPASVLLHTTP